MSTNQPTNSGTPNWRELRRQERAERRAARESGAWIIGAALILVGIFLMLANIYGMPLNNWWALFILLPAAGCLAAAWTVFREEGNFLSVRLLVPLVIGLVLLGVAAIFLFEIAVSWTVVVPAVLILVGVIVLIGSVAARS